MDIMPKRLGTAQRQDGYTHFGTLARYGGCHATDRGAKN
jgi:hypothetical protein